MSVIKRIKSVEALLASESADWIQSLPDEELERLAESGGSNPLFTKWLRTLTDDEVLTIRDDSPGAKRLMEKFNGHNKQNKKA